ncbi:MAG: dihydroorotate dehydrogenase [bacterium]
MTNKSTETPVDLKVSVARMDLTNPVIMASGTWGYGMEIPQIIEQMDSSKLGGIALKGIFYEPRRGNPTPRLAETPGGLLNAIGLEGVGVKAMVEEILPTLHPRKTKIIVNICGTSLDEYVRITQEMVQSAGDLFDAIEVNISCPNLDCGGVEFGRDPVIAADVTRAVCQAANGKPVLVKLPPLVTDIAGVAIAVAQAGADGLSLVNTYPAMLVDLERRRPVLAKNFGGLSGPAIKPMALRVVCMVSRALRERGIETDIIGMGGISAGRDALEYILAGAHAIALGTINFTNPLAYENVLAEMESLMRQRFQQSADPDDLSVRSWTGKLDLN